MTNQPENHETAEVIRPAPVTTQARSGPSSSESEGLLSRMLGSNLTAGVVVVGIILSGALFLSKQGYRISDLLPQGGLTSSQVVVFDPVKFINAQRAAASILASSKNQDMALSLTRVAKGAEAEIERQARGATVLVKQAVVGGSNLRDITDDVLKAFGLSTNVPTVTTEYDSIEYLAPTNSTFSAGRYEEDERVKRENNAFFEAMGDQRSQAQKDMLP